jgi:hypothetical protein
MRSFREEIHAVVIFSCLQAGTMYILGIMHKNFPSWQAASDALPQSLCYFHYQQQQRRNCTGTL